MELLSILMEGGAVAVLAGVFLLLRRDVKGLHAHINRLEGSLQENARRLDRQSERIAWLYGARGGPIPESDDEGKGGP